MRGGRPGHRVKIEKASNIWLPGLFIVVGISLGALLAWSQAHGHEDGASLPSTIELGRQERSTFTGETEPGRLQPALHPSLTAETVGERPQRVLHPSLTGETEGERPQSGLHSSLTPAAAGDEAPQSAGKAKLSHSESPRAFRGRHGKKTYTVFQGDNPKAMIGGSTLRAQEETSVKLETSSTYTATSAVTLLDTASAAVLVPTPVPTDPLLPEATRPFAPDDALSAAAANQATVSERQLPTAVPTAVPRTEGPVEPHLTPGGNLDGAAVLSPQEPTADLLTTDSDVAHSATVDVVQTAEVEAAASAGVAQSADVSESASTGVAESADAEGAASSGVAQSADVAGAASANRAQPTDTAEPASAGAAEGKGAVAQAAPQTGTKGTPEDVVLPGQGPATEQGGTGGAAEAVPRGPASPKPWEEEIVSVKVCTDTCSHARNGECNDGRHGRQRVWCDLGTDCEDCGSWVHRLPASQAAQPIPTPVAELVESGVEVYVRDTVTEPAFRMAYTNGSKDIDVSASMDSAGVVESGLTRIWWEVLKPQGSAPCLLPQGGRGLVVDVGGNFGWYTLYAASIGCRVMVWEPVPLFRAFMEFGLQLNHLLPLVDLHKAVVSPDPGPHKVVIPTQGIWGMAGVDGLNLGSVPTEYKYEVTVPGEQLNQEVKEEVQLLKVDVEGYEVSVFATAVSLFEEGRVKTLALEYSPGVYESRSLLKEYIEWPRVLSRLLDWGYTILHVPWPQAKGLMLPPHNVLKVVSRENLAYDLHDARLYANRQLGCPLPEPLKEFTLMWKACNHAQLDAHPKSFRSTFAHNTNIIATKNTSSLKVGGIVGVFPMDQPDTEFFTRSGAGLFGFVCALTENKYLVRFRCPCRNMTECGREHKLAEEWYRNHPPSVPESI